MRRAFASSSPPGACSAACGRISRRPGSTIPSSATRVPSSPTPGRAVPPPRADPVEGRETIAALQEEGFRVNCYVNDELYVARATEAERYAWFQHLPIHEVGDLEVVAVEPPTKLVAIGDPDELDGLEARMKRFAGRLYISKSLPFFLEFASPAVTKGSGLTFLAEHLGFTPERTVAFGDGENDVELLEWPSSALRSRTPAPSRARGRRLGLPSAEEESRR